MFFLHNVDCGASRQNIIIEFLKTFFLTIFSIPLRYIVVYLSINILFLLQSYLISSLYFLYSSLCAILIHLIVEKKR